MKGRFFICVSAMTILFVWLVGGIIWKVNERVEKKRTYALSQQTQLSEALARQVDKVAEAVDNNQEVLRELDKRIGYRLPMHEILNEVGSAVPDAMQLHEMSYLLIPCIEPAHSMRTFDPRSIIRLRITGHVHASVPERVVLPYLSTMRTNDILRGRFTDVHLVSFDNDISTGRQACVGFMIQADGALVDGRQ